MNSRQEHLYYLKKFVQSGGAICKENKEIFAILETIKNEIEFLLDNKLEVKYGMRLHPKTNQYYKKTWTMYVNKYCNEKLVNSLIIFQIHLDHFDKYILEWRGNKEYNLDEQEIMDIWDQETQPPDGYFINSLAKIYCDYVKVAHITKVPMGFLSILKDKNEEVLEEVAKAEPIKEEEKEEEIVQEPEVIKKQETAEPKKARRVKKNKKEEETK